ncbi:5111_t:CDS:2, partial [Rhizophagus irregularis]
RRIRELKSNIEKWRFLNIDEVRIHSQLSHHIWKFTAAIMTKQYIKLSDLTLLYSKVNSHNAYNELTEDIFLNHTFDEDNFALIRAFKKDSTLSKKKIATKEDYNMIHHIFTKYQWYNELLQAIERRKEVNTNLDVINVMVVNNTQDYNKLPDFFKNA